MSKTPTLLLIPGLLSDVAAWQPVADRLAPIANVEIADLSGLTSLPGAAQALLDQYPGSLCVAGHSMGARIALEMVRCTPQRIEKLALLDTGTHPVREGEREKRQVLVDLAYSEGMRALAQRWLPPMVHPDRLTDEKLMTTLTDMVLRFTPQQHEHQINALLNRLDGDPILQQVRCPVLLLVGKDDQWSPPQQHRDMLQHLGHALSIKLVEIDHAGHFAPTECPQLVAAAMAAWLMDEVRNT
jgi:pimeloyl-ACP methyl ester carboxylesterase